MPNCEFVTLISLLACNIAKDKSPEELNTLSAFFVQLRRYSCNAFNFKLKFIQQPHSANFYKFLTALLCENNVLHLPLLIVLNEIYVQIIKQIV